MPVNWVRGFRRLGWIISLPLAAFIVLLFYDQTKEFAGYNHEAITAYLNEHPQHIDKKNPESYRIVGKDKDKVIADLKIVDEFMKRRDQLDPQKQAIVDELARRMNVTADWFEAHRPWEKYQKENDTLRVLQNFRAKYGSAYDDMSDQELLSAIQRKWPGSYDDLSLATQTMPAEETTVGGFISNIPESAAERLAKKLAAIPPISKEEFELMKEQRAMEIEALLKEERLTGKTPDELSKLRSQVSGLEKNQVEEVYRINKIKFSGLLLGSIVGVAFIIQGSISILAWVFRGFKG